MNKEIVSTALDEAFEANGTSQNLDAILCKNL